MTDPIPRSPAFRMARSAREAVTETRQVAEARLTQAQADARYQKVGDAPETPSELDGGTPTSTYD